VSNRKVSNHPSHRRVTNVPGHVRASGKIVKGYSRVSNSLPPNYDPSYTSGTGIAAVPEPVDGPMGVVTGPSGPDQAW
jgi:hypothetical protein